MSFFLAITSIILKFLGLIDVPGWTSMFVIISLFFSLLFLNLAVIAIYLSKSIEESKKSAAYFIEELLNYE